LIKCQRGTSFLMCIPIDSGSYWGVDLKKASSSQLKINQGGDKVRISGRQFFCFKGSPTYLFTLPTFKRDLLVWYGTIIW
jgi:hypothetical protein